MVQVEADLLAAIAADPSDVAVRLVYADWLEQQGDRRCRFIREHLRAAPLAPDHPERLAVDEVLSRERIGLDPAWIAVIEPTRRCCHDPVHANCREPRSLEERLRSLLRDEEFRQSFLNGEVRLRDGEVQRRMLQEISSQAGVRQDGEDDEDLDAHEPSTLREIELHAEPQDTECEGWRRLLEYIDRVAAEGLTEFAPRQVLAAEEYRQILTLPPAIAKLTSVTSMDLRGSYLVRIPPEIGDMTGLRTFDPYQSYSLHWFPYEITRCGELRDSRISTRALYGNSKFRPPFPRLSPRGPHERGAIRPCSVCRSPFEDLQRFRVWISLRVATDVLPLLVNACSAACVERLPAPPERYIPGPHRGGLEVEQPDRE